MSFDLRKRVDPQIRVILEKVCWRINCNGLDNCGAYSRTAAPTRLGFIEDHQIASAQRSNLWEAVVHVINSQL